MVRGLIHIYYGNGKGKTTAAMGQALRAIGHGYKVAVIQFLKGSGLTGEFMIAERLKPNFDIWQYGKTCIHEEEIKKGNKECVASCKSCFFDPANPKDKTKMKLLTQQAWKKTKEVVFSLKYDLVILDEISYLINYKLLNSIEILTLLKEKPPEEEIILTGRQFPLSLLEYADYVSEIKSNKHPVQRLIRARRGIEY